MTGQTQQADAGTPLPGDEFWRTFEIVEESPYDDDGQDAAALAEMSASELTGHLLAVTIFEEALAQGRNPLLANARPFTDKQRKQLEEDLAGARQMLDCMLEECANAFGEGSAALLFEYVLRKKERAFNELQREPVQPGLF